jgi:hypothetical protein
LSAREKSPQSKWRKHIDYSTDTRNTVNTHRFHGTSEMLASITGAETQEHPKGRKETKSEREEGHTQDGGEKRTTRMFVHSNLFPPIPELGGNFFRTVACVWPFGGPFDPFFLTSVTAFVFILSHHPLSLVAACGESKF